MGMFSVLMGKVFGHASTQPVPAPTAQGAPAPAPGTVPGATSPNPAASSPTAPTATPPSAASPVTAPSVDVAAILDGLATKNSENLDWKKSIVDLLKLVGMDSSLSARKELAKDLGFSGDESDSATMNVWLHKEVLKKLAANGGKVPADLLD